MFALNKFFNVPLACLGLLTSCPKNLYAQSKFIDPPNEYFIKHYTDQEGFSQNRVKSIAKDSRGYIWLSTDMGLARFDGPEFKPFRNFESIHSDLNESTLAFLINPGGTSKADFYVCRDTLAFIHIFDGTAQKASNLEYINMIHNLLDKAIKIKKAGSIDIQMKKEKEKLHLVIADQGPGFSSALLNWINNDDSQLPEDYEGLGLLMVKEIYKNRYVCRK